MRPIFVVPKCMEIKLQKIQQGNYLLFLFMQMQLNYVMILSPEFMAVMSWKIIIQPYLRNAIKKLCSVYLQKKGLEPVIRYRWDLQEKPSMERPMAYT